MVIFEERIRQNISNLRRIRRLLRLRIILLSTGVLVLLFLHARFVSVATIFRSPSLLTFLGLLFLYGALLSVTILLVAALREWRNSVVTKYVSGCPTGHGVRGTINHHAQLSTPS